MAGEVVGGEGRGFFGHRREFPEEPSQKAFATFLYRGKSYE